MILKSLRLQNIRSYVDTRVQFPLGSVLLAGDIGSGKSTILAGIEFALFGLGELSSEGLLRHGCQRGNVELIFTLDSQEITVQRALRATKTGIVQDTCILTMHGLSQQLTPTELKAHILGILGYPRELVSKSKNALYRYTVYTPQEEMKAILFAPADERLNVLRRVFGIDKYKRIAENAAIYIRSLRERARLLEGKTADLAQKQQFLLTIDEQITAKKNTLSSLESNLRMLQECALAGKEARITLEHQTQLLMALRSELTSCEAEHRYKQEFLQRHADELARILPATKQLRIELTSPALSALPYTTDAVQHQVAKAETEISKITGLLAEARTHIQHHTSVKKQVLGLDKCPVCLQSVTQEHKRSIVNSADEQLWQWQTSLKQHEQAFSTLSSSRDLAKKQLEELRSRENQLRELSFKRSSLQDKEQLCLRLEETVLATKELLQTIEKKCHELNEQMTTLLPVEQELLTTKTRLEQCTTELHAKEVEYARIGQDLRNLTEQREFIATEVKEKQQLSNRLTKLRSLLSWLEDFFVPLMGTVERHVFSRVWGDFNSLFSQWFGVLVPLDLSARLDDSFSPIITQNGFETAIDDLSGGERTAAALAYRFALNRVVNEVTDSMQTKDVIILDEPTDGFSDEQLERMRDVLLQLGVRQVIIVSHEQKLEGFVDHVMRVAKEAQVSSVSS